MTTTEHRCPPRHGGQPDRRAELAAAVTQLNAVTADLVAVAAQLAELLDTDGHR